jgi:hypothetical protein
MIRVLLKVAQRRFNRPDPENLRAGIGGVGESQWRGLSLSSFSIRHRRDSVSGRPAHLSIEFAAVAATETGGQLLPLGASPAQQPIDHLLRTLPLPERI